MTDVQTRAMTETHMRSAPAPIKDADLWGLPEDQQMTPHDADVLMHSLQFRALERVRLARHIVKEKKRAVKRAEAELKDAQRSLKAERTNVAAFLNDGDYDKATATEMWRDIAPDRFTA